MGTHYVFTSTSLQLCLESASSHGWFEKADVPDNGAWGVLAVDVKGCRFFIHHRDKQDSPRIILISQNGTPLASVPSELRRATLERVHRVALEVGRPPLRLPPGWSPYHYRNLLAFFANPHGLGAGGLRWITELRPDGSDDICFWKLTTPEAEVRLPSFVPPREVYRDIVHRWPEAFAAAIEQFRRVPAPAERLALQPTIDLEKVSVGSVTRYRNYSTWLELVTPQQQKFIEWPAEHAVRLQGPAGSGKTLALELKVLHELYQSRTEGRSVRILFATHSWALAEQVDKALHSLDESGNIDPIDVLPLLEISRSILPAERHPSPEFRLLGEDSLTGKRQQLTRIDEVLDRLARSDWLAYQSQASPAFLARVSAPRGSGERNALVWDLMIEFYSVLSAHGILPGVTAERRYLRLQRSSWMMPLASEADKKFIIRVYTEYLAGLKREQLLTSDQLVNDFLNYLETFAWDLRRERDGYDLLFVDELHLFSEQERLVLHYLTRSAAQFPRIFMASDPAQAPTDVYGDFPMAEEAQGRSEEPEAQLGSVGALELGKIHRFTPEILDLIRHMQRRYPALDLWRDWETYSEPVEATSGHGVKPIIYTHPTQSEEIAAVAQRAERLMSTAGAEQRCAIILIDELQLETYEHELSSRTSLRLAVIEGRDDVDKLQYARRSVVVSAAEYLAGLQFDEAVIAALPNTRSGLANLGYQRRRLLRLLYLAISRATRHVEIHVNDECGGVPEILETALLAGVVQRGDAA